MKKTFTSFILALLCIVAVAQDFSTMPENGSSVDMLSDITITWDNATSVSVDPMLMVGGAKVYSIDGSNKTFVSDIICGPTAGNSLVMSLLSATSDAGDYLVELSENMFTVDGTPMGAFTLNYTIGGIPTSNATITIDVVDNALSQMLMTVDPCSQLALNPEATEAIQIIHNKGFSAYYAASYTPEIKSANSATLTADKELGEGLYTLIIPRGTFLIDGKINREILKEFDYSIPNPANNYTIDPADGSTLSELVEITITWEEATAIEVNPEKMIGGIMVYQIDGEFKNYAAEVFCGPTFGNYVLLSLTRAVSDAGDYVVEIPDNMFTVDGTPIAAFSISYNIPGTPTSSATINATLDNGSLSTIVLTFDPCTNLALYEPAEGETIEAPFIIHNKGFDAYQAATYTITITGENTATLTTDKNLGAGNYTLHIPKGNFLIDGKLNKLALFDFDNTAVENIVNDNARIKVYDLRGIQVIDNGTANELKSLEPGIYIVNGKKQVVRGNQ